jgi:hypothetical protein
MTTDPHALIRILARVGVILTVHDNKLKYRGPQRMCTGELLKVLRTHKPGLMRTLKIG